MDRKIIYKKQLTSEGLKILRYAINPNGKGYTDIGIANETDIDYINYLNEKNEVEELEPVFPDIDELKNIKIAELNEKCRTAILEGSYDGASFDEDNQRNVAIGIIIDEDYIADMKNHIIKCLNECRQKKEYIKSLEYKGKTIQQKLLIIKQINEL